MSRPRRLELARVPTPIYKLERTSKALGREIFIWRDDLTGCLESGNKVRKLEFLLADALSKKCDWIVTCGGIQSNHTRATAALARRMGLGISVVVSPPKAELGRGFDPAAAATGNFLLNRILGSEIKFVPAQDFQKSGGSFDSFLEAEAAVQRARGRKPYVIPLGGSSPLGCYAYVQAVQEMMKTWPDKKRGPDSIFCALGSGGTFSGLSLGVETHPRLKRAQAVGVNILGKLEDQSRLVSRLMRETANQFKLKWKEASASRHRIVDGFVGAGYAMATDEDLKFYAEFARREGVVLDPCYTGKAFRGMVSEIQNNGSSLGKRILFLYSGGVFGTFAYSEQFRRALT